MKRSPYLQYINLLFIIFWFSVNAQENQKILPLYQVLQKIESHYNYQFNYADDVIKDIVIYPPSTDINFKQVLNYLAI